jgi:hypothetical protein
LPDAFFRAVNSSAFFASSIACSSISVTKALIFGLCLSMRLKTYSVSSREEMAPLRRALTACVAVPKLGSNFLVCASARGMRLMNGAEAAKVEAAFRNDLRL